MEAILKEQWYKNTVSHYVHVHCGCSLMLMCHQGHIYKIAPFFSGKMQKLVDLGNHATEYRERKCFLRALISSAIVGGAQ